jgi:hypothetical protein
MTGMYSLLDCTSQISRSSSVSRLHALMPVSSYNGAKCTLLSIDPCRHQILFFANPLASHDTLYVIEREVCGIQERAF